MSDPTTWFLSGLVVLSDKTLLVGTEDSEELGPLAAAAPNPGAQTSLCRSDCNTPASAHTRAFSRKRPTAMADENEQWSCPACTLMNAYLAEACEACGTTSPLVIESYAAEEQGWTTAQHIEDAMRRSSGGSSANRSRSSTQDAAAGFTEDIAGELDPWVQAEREWAHVEAHQEERPKRK